MLASVSFNLINLLFPLACYFLYLVYSKATYENEKVVFLDLALFSSYYLCSRFDERVIPAIFLINIPLILALYKKRLVISLVLSVLTAVSMANIHDCNAVIYLICYLLICLGCFFTKLKTVNIFISIRVFSDIIIASFITKHLVSVYSFIEMLLMWGIMYVIFLVVITFYSKFETIVKMYHSLEEITKEKTLYESLFKITHEIKNPLTVCKGYAEMLDLRNPAKANKCVTMINQEINRTLVILKDFSDVSKLNIEKNIMDITMLLEDVCDECKIIFKNNIEFSYKVSDQEIFIEGDYNRLKQVLVNVIKNAKEAIKERGKVVLEGKKQKNNYVISVKDNGEGMDAETASKIGTAFHTTKKNGTGLGVCFSKEIVEKHAGTMKYYTKENRGTTVKITLPLYKAPTNF
ncbi:MAG: HAMP domain-containing sensor histidine kinase [Bacilli bacterium]|nr:HAMP domain-containing sensor histidine kinase [Bacilli bacterium]